MSIDEEENEYDIDFEVRQVIVENPIIQTTFDKAQGMLSMALDMINVRLAEKTNGRILCSSYSMRVSLDAGAKVLTKQ